MSYEHRISKVELLHQLIEIICISVHVAVVPWLAGAAVATAIMTNHPVSMIG
jgi:hypothetical protein